jgi:hypothetical protein
MFRRIADLSEGIKLLALVGSAIKPASSPLVPIAGVETRFNSSLDIAWLEVLV